MEPHTVSIHDELTFDWVVLPARLLTREHLGWEMYLDGDWAQDDEGRWRWVKTWAPLVRIEHDLAGVTVRRHPGDKMGQHYLRADNIYPLRKKKETPA